MQKVQEIMVNRFEPQIFSLFSTHLIVSDCTYVRREACDGDTIMDIELDQDECIDR